MVRGEIPEPPLFQAEDVYCVKCSSYDQHDVRYIPPYSFGYVDGMVHQGPFMLRTCKRCGHEWQERCLDS